MFPSRFSLRALTIFITLACIYLGAWQATKHWGIPQIRESLSSAGSGVEIIESPAPFLVYTVGGRFVDGTNLGSYWNVEERFSQYSLWLFGLTLELPFGHTETSSDHGTTIP